MFFRLLRSLLRYSVTLICGLLISVVFLNVILRYVFNSGLPFAEDLARYLMVVLVFLASGLALDEKQHVAINLFTRGLTRKVQLWLALLGQVASFAFLVLITVKGIELLPNQMQTEIPTMTGISMFWFYLGIPVGGVLMGLFLLRIFANTAKELIELSSEKPDEQNKAWSVAFISISFIILVGSCILFYMGHTNFVFIILLSCFAFTVAIGMPVAFCLGIAGIGFILLTDDLPLLSVPTLMFGGISPFALMAITAFILCGLLVEKTGVVESLVDFSDSIVGHLPGGLAHTNIVSSMFFAGVSGAALADTAAIGSVMIPAMKKSGYDAKFSAVITAASSIVGPVIPPSVGMIIYAYAVGGAVSIGALFVCGAIPGIVLGLGMMVITHFYSVKRKYPVRKDGFSGREMMLRGKKAIWGLMIPVIILAGIMAGVFTPTEAGAIATFYAIFTGMVITRKLTVKDIFNCLLETAIISAVIFFMLSTAKIITYILTLYDAPDIITNLLQTYISSPFVFILVVMGVLLLIGFVLEAVATMIMLVPVFAPVAATYGIEPHHFGLLVVMTVQLALLTPPVALGLFITCRLAGVEIEDVMSDVWPFLVLIFGMIGVLALFPQLTLWLPKLLGMIH
jgi:tripartite ATP-independent transporter DctM subunit